MSWPGRKRPSPSEPRYSGSARPPQRLVDLVGELAGLARADHRAEVQLGQRVVRARRRPAGGRSAGRRSTGRYVVEERGEQPALHDEARVGGAALLGVLEALAEVLGEQRPLGEVPDAPGVEALLLEEVPAPACRRATWRPRGRWSGRRRRPARRCPGLLTSTSPSFDPAPGQQRHRQAGAGHEGVREGEAVEAALAWASSRRRRCRPAPAPARRAPARSSGSSSWRCWRPGRAAARARRSRSSWRSISSTYQRTPSSPRSTSAQASRHGLPISQHQQQREQVAVRGHHVDGRGHPLLALVELDLRPVRVLAHRGLDGRDRGRRGRPAAAPGSGVPSTGLTW